MEYGGPDTGYLSVTIDCLWDYFELTKDDRALETMKSAADFIAHMVSVSGRIPTMINSRNTDYLVPYGLVRLGSIDSTTASVIRAVYSNIDSPEHFPSFK